MKNFNLLALSISIFFISFCTLHRSLVKKDILNVAIENCKTTNATVVNFEKNIGIIFNEKHSIIFTLQDFKQRFTPDSQLIKSIDDKIKKQMSQAGARFIHNQVFDRTESIYGTNMTEKDKVEEEKSLLVGDKRWSDNYDNFYKQYVGYINNIGEKIIVIQLINLYNASDQDRSYFSQDYIIGSGGWYDANTRSYDYNVDKNLLNFHGWQHLR